MTLIDQLAALVGIAIGTGTMIVALIRIGYLVEHGRIISAQLAHIIKRLDGNDGARTLGKDARMVGHGSSLRTFGRAGEQHYPEQH